VTTLIAIMSLEMMSPASHWGSKRRRRQPFAAVCACARTRGVAHRPVSHAPAVLYNAARRFLCASACRDPLSRRSTAASACVGQRQHAEGGDGSRPAGLSTAVGCSDTDVQGSEAGTLLTERRPSSATAYTTLRIVASASCVLPMTRDRRPRRGWSRTPRVSCSGGPAAWI
jgi:hypothetical protein